MNDKVLITGSDGMVGSRFVELYPNKNELLAPTIAEFDLLNPHSMERYLKNNPVSSVINFAAYTDVREAEKDRGNENGLCWNINIKGIKNLVSLFGSKVHLVHISTDMVFSGSKDDKGPYKEVRCPERDPSKVTWYGYTKGEGENIIREADISSTIIRIIYPVRAKYDNKSDYLRKHLKLYNDDALYPMFSDQKISVTFIDELCTTIGKILSDKIRGVYHCSSSDTTTPYELISYLIEAKYGVKNTVKSESIHEFLRTSDNKLRYPVFGGLKCGISQKALGIRYSTWKQIVNILVGQNISP